ncbi:truncated hydrolase [Salmonella enterica]|uniref:Truncated hydrolase n=1 Tax=Salmonella enterica TaxID=28901 RepID=A0A379Q9Q4_SALER|nr:truncated hydrolase [Salmonella enterica]
MKKNAVVIHPQDGVATAITALRAGETATMFIGEQEISVVLRQAVPFGHKFAICDVPFHGEVYKYGESGRWQAMRVSLTRIYRLCGQPCKA